jgi:hypothetical protein
MANLARDGLRRVNPIWSDPTRVHLHSGWVVDGQHYRCVPRSDRAISWFEPDQIAEADAETQS